MKFLWKYLVLATTDGKLYNKPVWMVSKHRSGYSLKLLWGVEQKSALKSPNSANPSFLEETATGIGFLVKKRPESSILHTGLFKKKV